MKLFGWKAGRAASPPARPALARGFATWTPTEATPASYTERVREAYLANPVAQRAARLVVDGVAGAPLRSNRPEVLELIRARSAGQALLETAALNLLLHGDAYLQLLGDADDALELFALRPERVSIERDARGWPAAFLYRAGDSQTRIAAEDASGRPQLIHLRLQHPLDDHYGLGCLQAAAGAVAIHNAATRWNAGLLANAVRPSGALVFEGGEGGATLSNEQFERLRAELDLEFSGAGNAGRPMLLEGGLKWQALSLTPADMDFVGLKAAAAREIALAFGVPPMLLGLPGDAAYANYREANKALWRLAVLPLAGLILGGLADGLRARFPGLELGIDLDRVPALSEERERLWAQVTAADFLSREEKRAAVGLSELGSEAAERSD